MVVVLLSLCRPPPWSSCCFRCPRYRYARRDAVTGLTRILPDGRPCRRHAHHLAMLLSLCRPPPCSSCCSRCPRYRYARRDAVAGLAEMLADEMEFKARQIVDDYRVYWEDCRAYMQYPPRLFVIMRGLPGSGKTTFAQEREGSYVFDASRLWEVHRSCNEQCRELLWRSPDRGVDIVIVDNCNLRMDDFERYQDLHIPSDKLAYFNIWRHNAPEEPRLDNEVDTVDELHIDNELTTVNMPRAYIITLEEFMRAHDEDQESCKGDGQASDKADERAHWQVSKRCQDHACHRQCPKQKRKKGEGPDTSPDTSPSPRKQRKTAKKTGEGSNVTTRELGAASASEDEATTRDEETTPLVPKHALRSTCLALQKKIADEKGEHRQGPRRKAGDYYKMADYQKRVWAEKYTAARNSSNDLDYEALSKLTQFKAFKNNPEELQRHEPALLKEFYEFYLADQALKADAHAQTAGSGSSKLSQRGGAEHLAIEQCDIQAAQQLTAARNQASLASDQAPGPPISQTPVAVQEEALQQFREKLDEEKQQGARQLEEVQARSRKLEEQLAAAAKELAELRNDGSGDGSGDDRCTVIAHEWKKTAAKLAEEKAISNNLLKAQASHAKKLQDVHEDMNNLTREVDERKKKLEGRENEEATRDKNMENKEEELQVKAEELQSHDAKLKEEDWRLWNVTHRLQREREQLDADKKKREKPSRAKQQGGRISLKQAKILNEMKRQTRLLEEQFKNNGCPAAFKELEANRNRIEEERAAMQAERDGVRTQLESMKAALEAVKTENSGLQDTIARRELQLHTYKYSAVTKGAIEEFTEWNAEIRNEEARLILGKMKEAFGSKTADAEEFKALAVEFWVKRNELVHDKTGTVIHSMDHGRYACVCAKIMEALAAFESAILL
ncbi:hypothetical protein PHYSODRAFT_330180 [Phytophthora sojae]|uniref:Uncharacterized protein n=2 Tax=Phytophthora TaxID=4783 RepID=G4Z5P9_PHYSP|nr:hypothetical protein PHYSODRAFT_330180 [Phytophthora sojae]EGZ22363.1 hypothetical protein PHYSODRAFT_330180 [Phytophthora sojae]|eukprot:XP_009525080.1 hypothetical protein PHYSODRAFT_330180 [Phytophthora sojae]